jgi:hypothetical protein
MTTSLKEPLRDLEAISTWCTVLLEICREKLSCRGCPGERQEGNSLPSIFLSLISPWTGGQSPHPTVPVSLEVAGTLGLLLAVSLCVGTGSSLLRQMTGHPCGRYGLQVGGSAGAWGGTHNRSPEQHLEIDRGHSSLSSPYTQAMPKRKNCISCWLPEATDFSPVST